jgi:hypothetical protein
MRYTIHRIRPKRDGGGMLPLGTRAEVLAAFARMNTAPDHDGGRFLYGPGMRIELTTEGIGDGSREGVVQGSTQGRAQTPVLSAEVKVAEEELFEIVFQGTASEFPGPLAKMIRRHGWHLLNLETGSCYPPMPVDSEDID